MTHMLGTYRYLPTPATRILADPVRRRTLLIAVGGVFIAAGILSRHAVDAPAMAEGFFAAASVVTGTEIAVRALRALRRRAASIELLVTIAAAGALLIGESWEAAAVTFLFLFGAYLEARALRRTRSALEGLLETAPTTAVVVRDGRTLEVAPHEVALDETVLVRPGAAVPVDGEVLDGRSAVDESSITGEPLPASKKAGASVYAGTVNGAGLLRVRATGTGADTMLARIVRRVEEAQEAKAPTQRFLERFASWYTPAVVVLAAVAWAIAGDVRLALTLLVIACPGALVISTPVSIVAGIGRAARRGILVKGGERLESAGAITLVALDKTGTVTRGEPRLMDVEVLGPVPAPPGRTAPGPSTWHAGRTGAAREGDAVLAWAAIAERGSEHPLARPILAAVEDHADAPHPEAFEHYAGRGIRASWSGHDIAVGNAAFMQDLGVALDAATESRLDRLRTHARTPVLVAVDGAPVGLLGIADPPRPEAVRAVAALRERMRVVMLSGDDPRAARAVADEVGIDEAHGGLLPEDKLAWIRRLQAEGEVVAMVGDGINDAPALAAADVGVAMGAAGTGVALEAADMALMADDLAKLPEAVALSRAVLRNIHQNVGVALATVAALLAGVLLGEVHMAGGMLVHEASVLIVIGNAMRLLR